MKRIIVTPAGRRQFLEILYRYLVTRQEQFDQWVLWANTDNPDDLAYIYELSTNNDFITHIDLDVKFNYNFSISSFFKYCIDPDAMYLRLDDDICYIHENAIDKIFNFREQNQKPFLVFGNIVNNFAINHIQQRFGNYDMSFGKSKYSALAYIFDSNSINVSVGVHELFMRAHDESKLDSLMFKNRWIMLDYERVSINAVSWLGKDFASFDGIPDFSGQAKQFSEDEEEFLSCTMPRRLGRPNEICGDSLFVHFSFHPLLNQITNDFPHIYEFYKKVSNSLL